MIRLMMTRIAGLSLFLISPLLYAGEATLEGKHLYDIRPGIDTLWGRYLFAVRIVGEGSGVIETPLVMPKEMVDFVPLKGLEAADLTLGDRGLELKKELTERINVLGVAFQVKASFGSATMTVTPPRDLGNFTMFIPDTPGFSMHAPFMERVQGPAPDGSLSFQAKAGLKKGETYSFEFKGIPEGRGRLWIVGWITGLLAVLAALVLALRTRPRPDVVEYAQDLALDG